ncbi:HAD family hydrolase [Promicromonospora sp. NPDC023805]|uniref:HAD family hydrolase n=1 Tax=Promicromonospora sp. NPDC023805 TaxID=3154696 RepID=UPI0033C9DD92
MTQKTATAPPPTPLATAAHLVALDVDGTLAHSGRIPDVTVAAVRAALAAGHHLVIATGRSLVGVAPIIKRLGLRRGHVVCSNGAVTVRISGRRLVIEDAVRFDAGPALRRAVDLIPEVLLATEVLGKGYRVNDPFPGGLLNGRQRVVRRARDLWAAPTGRARDLWAAPTTRAVVHAPGVGRLARELRWFDVTVTLGSTTEPGDWLDLTAAGLSKASGLEAVRRRLRVAPEHTVAVGDGHNDLPMFEWAARAVAMGNAPAAVQAAAGEVCGSVTEHGVVEVLRTMAGVR